MLVLPSRADHTQHVTTTSRNDSSDGLRTVEGLKGIPFSPLALGA